MKNNKVLFTGQSVQAAKKILVSFLPLAAGKAVQKAAFLLLLCLATLSGVYAQTNTYAAGTTGTWNTPANWSMGLPTANQDVVIPATSNVTVDVSTIPATGTDTLNSLTVNGTLTYSVSGARTIKTRAVTITGNFSSAATGSVVTHSLIVAGSMVNNGTLNFSTNGNTAGANVTFTGGANASFTTSASASTTFRLITLNKGTSNTPILDFNPSNTVTFPSTGSLAITNGTFKLNGSVPISNPIFAAAAYSIPAAGGFWLNNSAAVVTGQAGSPTVAGTLRITSGIFNIGTTNNSMGFSAGANIFIEGGIVNAVARFGVATAGNAITYTQTGGTVYVNTAAGNASTAQYSFDLGTSAGTSFSMSAGSIVLAQQSTGTTVVDYRAPGGLLNISGGTLQIGTAAVTTPAINATAANANFRIQGFTTNIVLDNGSSNNPGFTTNGALSVYGDMTLNGSGTFTKGNFALTMLGLNATNPGNIIVSGTNALSLSAGTTAALGLTFNGVFGNQIFSLGSGSVVSNQIGGLTINNSFVPASGLSSVTIPTGLSMVDAAVLTLSQGTLNTGVITAGITATASVPAGSTASFIQGALIRTFTGNPTLVNSAFPVGKNGVFMPMSLRPATSGIVQLKAEAFTGGTGTNISPAVSETYSHYWKAENVSVTPANLTNLVAMVEGDANIVTGNLILKSTAANGTYKSIAPYTSTYNGVVTPPTLTSNTMTTADFMATNYYAFGSGCATPVTLTGPVNICIGSTSQIYSTSATGTWSSSDVTKATVDASGNVTGVAAGAVTITFTDGSAVPCIGIPYTRTVNIVNCSNVPGGVGNNLVSWYKADDGLLALSTANWTDQVGQNTLSVAGTPSLTTNAINFNPSVTLNGSTDYYGKTNADGWLGTTNGTTYFTVAYYAPTVFNTRTVFSRGATIGNTTSQTLSSSQGTGAAFTAGGALGTAPYASGGYWINGPKTFLTRSGFNGGTASNYYVNFNANPEAIGGTPANLTPTIAGAANFYIGAPAGLAASNMWQGDIAEVIAFNGKQTAAAYNKVESYLALKYGITLNQTNTRNNYTASNGTIIWDTTGTTVSGFKNNIFGIGKDYAAGGSSLNQHISRSVNTGTLFTVATTNDFALSNQDASRTDLTNLNFEIFADNGGTNTWTFTGAKPGYKILNRQWQVQETGSVGNVYAQFDTATAAFPIPARVITSLPLYILTDPNADGDYSDGSAYPLTLTGGSLWSSAMDFTHGQKFTLATASPYAGRDTTICSTVTTSYNLTGIANIGTWSAAAGNPAGAILGTTTTGVATVNFSAAAFGNYNFVYTIAGATDTVQIKYSNCSGPGGVNAGLAQWFRADVNTITSGAVSQWDDQSFNNDNAVQPTASQQPIFAPNLLNFNPQLKFDGIDDVLLGTLTNSSVFTGTNDFSLYGLYNTAGTGSGFTQNGMLYGVNGSITGKGMLSGAGGFIGRLNNEVSYFFTTNTNTNYMFSVTRKTVSNFTAVLNGATTTTVPSSAIVPGNFAIGNNNPTSNLGLNGTMPEIIAYTRALTAIEQQKVNSYLALKYGFHLDQSTPQSYIARDGSFMWNATTAAAGFNNGIFGIGRDDTSRLYQRISRPASADSSVLTVAMDNNFTLSNLDAGRTTTINDLNFETFAHNNGANSWGYTPSLPGRRVLNRVWQVQETGSIGTVYVQFDTANAAFSIPSRGDGSQPFYIATDPNGDGDYSDGTLVALSNTSGSVWNAGLDFVSGSKFTIVSYGPYAGKDTTICNATGGTYTLHGLDNTGAFTGDPANAAGVVLGSTTAGAASVNFTAAPYGVYKFIYTVAGATDTVAITYKDCVGPGGVNPNLSIWLKADAGVAGTTTVSSWTDQSPNGIVVGSLIGPDATQSTLNFNPSLSFNQTTAMGTNIAYQDVFDYSSGYFHNAQFVVYKNRTSAPASGPTGGGLYGYSDEGGGYTGKGIGADVYGRMFLDDYRVHPNSAPAYLSTSMLSLNGNISAMSAKVNGGNEVTTIIPQVDGGESYGSFQLGYYSDDDENLGFDHGTADIAEIINFKQEITNAQRNQIHSYLALKYGITLDQTTPQNYIAGDGTTLMWNAATAASGFNNDIFGIGRDNYSLLNQKAAQSTNTDGGVLAVATDNNFTATNQDVVRTTSLNNLNFETFANDNGANTFTATGAPIGYQRLSRQWQVQETGTIGTVYVQFDTANAAFAIPARLNSGSPFYIITDPNADGNYTDGVIIPLTNTSGSVWSAGVDFTNGAAFTIATQIGKPNAGIDRTTCLGSAAITLSGTSPTTGTWTEQAGNPAGVTLSSTASGIATVQFAAAGVYHFVYAAGATDTMQVTVSNCSAAPGGVMTNLATWLKAGAGTNTNTDGDDVTNWTDQVGALTLDLGTPNAGFDPATAVKPQYVENAVNYNPGVLYNSSYHHKFTMPTLAPKQMNSTMYLAGNLFSASGYNSAWMSSATGTASGDNEWLMELTNGNLGYYSLVGGIDVATSLHWIQYNGAVAKQRYQTGNADIYSSLNGSAEQTLTNVLRPAVLADNHRYYSLGSDNNMAGYPFGGYITETMVYQNGTLSAMDAQKIESYMALKYGATMNNGGPGAGNYLLSNGATVWTAADNAAYHNQVVGIVRDDASGLTQKQSHTQDDSLRVFVSTLEETNAANTGSISNDHSSILIGNDGGILQADRSKTKPATIYSRFGRTWKITNTNFTDNYSVEMQWADVGNFDINDIRFLISSSPDFTNATIYANGQSGISISVGSIIVSGISTAVIPANSTMYFTIASASPLTPLPISLLNFTATKNSNQTATLNWQTAQEQNSSYFEVQHSTNAANWQALGKVNAAGSSTGNRNYQYLHSNPATGLNYYRLKSVDQNGAFTYSDIKLLRFGGDNKITVLPNPVTDRVYVTGSSATATIKMVQLFDAAGKLLYQSQNFGNSGAIDMSAYAKGMYLLKIVTDKGEIETHKLIKK